MIDLKKYPGLKETADKLGIPPFWLWYVIKIESNWNPKAVNKTTGASGLIQIMPSTAKGLGISLDSIRNSSAEAQLKGVVYKYLLPYKKKLTSLANLYLAILYPYAVGKSDKFVLGSERSQAFSKIVGKQNNPHYDINKDGVMTKGEIKKFVYQDAAKYGYKPSEDVPFMLRKLFTKK
jgi:hypothetical protein